LYKIKIIIIIFEYFLSHATYLVQATKRLLSLVWLWMYTQPNNDTLHAKSLAGGSLASKTEKGTKRNLNVPLPVGNQADLALVDKTTGTTAQVLEHMGLANSESLRAMSRT
jgi:hypothetical protein